MASIAGAIYTTEGAGMPTEIWGWSDSKIKLKLCSDDGEIAISDTMTSTTKPSTKSSVLSVLIGEVDAKTGTAKEDSKVEVSYDSGDLLSLLTINVDYVDLRCNFAAISLFEYDIYHWLRSEKTTPKREIYYLGRHETDFKNKPFYNIFNDSYPVDNSIKLFAKPEPPASGVWFSLTDYMFGFLQDICIAPLPPIENPPNYRQSSCAYDAINNRIVYYVKSGDPLASYSQTSHINPDTKLLEWIDFEHQNKADFIDNHQIAFYFIDLGG